MRLRPYINIKDFEYVKKWINGERTHAMWCANLIPYPVTDEALQEYLDKDANDWGGSAYIATEADGRPVGFFVYSVNCSENSGFFKFIVLDNELRGKGYGTQMIKLAIKYAFEITGVSSIGINVFDINISARKCYENVGFEEANYVKEAFKYKGEKWGRYSMRIMK